MPIHNADIAAVFEKIADLLEIESANPFRVRAYRNAARIVGELGRDVKGMVEKGENLTGLPGIGDDLAGKISEIVRTGTCGLLRKLERELPPAIAELLKVPGLGPKRVRALWQELHVQTLDDLQRAAREGRIQALPGFGEKTQQNILEAVQVRARAPGRMLLAVASQYADGLVEHLSGISGVKRVVVAGSYRRGREMVGDLDILVTAAPGAEVMERFAAYDEVRELLSSGATRASAVLKSGLQVDVRLVPEESCGSALQYFTGAKAHNIEIRRLAQERGLKVNEYGVFRGTKRIAGETEESVYRAMEMPCIPPELRENQGEIEAAHRGLLPKLVDRDDLRGDLHLHTSASDGHNSLEEMAQAGKQAGLAYLAVTEHSQRLKVARGLDPKRLLKHMEQVDRVNAGLDGVTLLRGVEVDILEDGSLDLPDDVLGTLDLVVGAVHGKFNLSRAKQTERILRAMDHPYFSILAHPTGRMLGSREAMDVDWLRVVRKARQRGCFLELNAQPERLDLPDSLCRMARDEGVLVSVASDAHSILDFAKLRFGVGQARRGWLERNDVLNTRPLKELKPLLRRTMGRR
ncbi:MAG TPA: DNA polymerase/3'-5' exonuclease PolX [Burkholderiales bacterium]|nr:DNA polymerase/3'-5' exonuclease PolX [Burkholderiales bacterium]